LDLYVVPAPLDKAYDVDFDSSIFLLFCTCLSTGKLDALLATLVFGYVTTRWIFMITSITCFIAVAFTWIFSADLTHVSLSEHDAQLELFLEGRPEKYRGRLNKYEHLSNYEWWTG
jgi:hypothetical protein